MTNGIVCETLTEFYAQILEFRRIISSKTIMENESRREGVVFGLALTWINLNLQRKDHTKADVAFRAALEEFTTRCFFIDHCQDRASSKAS